MTYYMNLLSKGTNGAYVALILLVLALIFIFLQAILAFGRGTSRSVARFFSVIIAAVVALYATRVVGRAFLPAKTLGELIPIKSARLAPILEASVAELLLPIVFIFLFVVCALFIVIPYKLFCGIFGFSYARNNPLTRWFSVLVGAVHALMAFVIVFLPFFSCVRAYQGYAKELPESSAAAFYEQYLEDTAQSPIYRYTMKYVGDRTLRWFENSHK